MKTITTLALALTASTALVGTATAADPMAADPMYDSPMQDEAMMAPSGFDWDRFYFGVGLGFMSSSTIDESVVSFKKEVGVNFVSDDFLFGIEGYLGYNNSLDFSDWWVAGAEARAGLLASEDALIYGAVGLEAHIDGSDIVRPTYGAGVEFVLSENSTLDVKYRYVSESITTANNWEAHSISASWNWYVD